MVEAGHIKPIIDRYFLFDEIVEAHSYVGKGHKIGGVVIRVI
jgi:NADPH:quinone reductase-like Zn-dependent oxidoreductase